MFSLTVFEILLLEGRSVLSAGHKERKGWWPHKALENEMFEKIAINQWHGKLSARSMIYMYINKKQKQLIIFKLTLLLTRPQI